MLDHTLTISESVPLSKEEILEHIGIVGQNMCKKKLRLLCGSRARSRWSNTQTRLTFLLNDEDKFFKGVNEWLDTSLHLHDSPPKDDNDLDWVVKLMQLKSWHAKKFLKV